MNRMLICFAAVIFSGTAFAADGGKPAKEIPLPEISYSQKVEIIVPLKKNPSVLSAEISQTGKAVGLALMVANNCNTECAKKAGNEFLLRTKNVTMDDPAGKDKPGKGMYDYAIKVIRANGKIIVEAAKNPTKKKLSGFEKPVSCADENAQLHPVNLRYSVLYISVCC